MIRNSTCSDGTAPEYVAFILALRSLPIQQREAFILHHGEGLKERWMGVAMDCSVIAAANHLNAAKAALRPIAGTNFGTFANDLGRVYRARSPSETMMVPKLRATIARHIWPRRIMRTIGWFVILGFVGAVAYGVRKVWPMLEF